jgi:aminoglycoside phosphotransferase (APT) family kinase protein
LLREPAVLELLARHGLPVPIVEAADLEGDMLGRPWFLASDAGGRTAADPSGLSPSNRRGVFVEMGRLLAKVHTIGFERPADFHGTLLLEADFGRSPLEQWHHRAWAKAAGLRLVGPDAPDEVAGGALAIQDRPAGYALCHGDFNPAQCVRHGPGLTAIVDWEAAHVGDPDYDLATFEVMLRVTAPADLAEAALEGYSQIRPQGLTNREQYRPVRSLHAAALAVLFHRRRRQGPMRAARSLALRLQVPEESRAA